MLALAGGHNVLNGATSRAVQVTTEILLQTAPEVVLEVRAEETLSASEIKKEIATWQFLSSLPAVRNSRVIFLTGSDLVIPGPRIAQAIARFALALHPDAPLPTQ